RQAPRRHLPLVPAGGRRSTGGATSESERSALPELGRRDRELQRDAFEDALDDRGVEPMPAAEEEIGRPPLEGSCVRQAAAGSLERGGRREREQVGPRYARELDQ